MAMMTTGQVMETDAQVQVYRDLIRELRLKRTGIYQRRAAVAIQIESLKTALADLMDLFQADAEGLFPDAINYDAYALSVSAQSGSPLWILREKYKPQVDSIKLKLKEKAAEYALDYEAEKSLMEEESKTYMAYASFRKYKESYVPSLEMFKAQIEATSVVEVVPANDVMITSLSQVTDAVHDYEMRTTAYGLSPESDAAVAVSGKKMSGGMIAALVGAAVILIGGLS